MCLTRGTATIAAQVKKSRRGREETRKCKDLIVPAHPKFAQCTHMLLFLGVTVEGYVFIIRVMTYLKLWVSRVSGTETDASVRCPREPSILSAPERRVCICACICLSVHICAFMSSCAMYFVSKNTGSPLISPPRPSIIMSSSLWSCTSTT